MSGEALRSIKQSPLLISLTEQSQKNLAYGLEPSDPNQIKWNVVANCSQSINTGTALANKEVSIPVTRAGFWANGMLETGLYPTADLTVAGTLGSGAIGLVLFSDIQVKSTNRTIFTQSDAYCVARTQSLPSAKAKAIFKRAHFLQTTAGSLGNIVALPLNAGRYTTMSPLFIPFFESKRNYVDLRMCEPLVVVCRFNSNAGMGIPDAVAMLSDTSVLGCTTCLHQWIVDYEPEVVQSLAVANWSIDSPLEYLAVNSVTGTTNGATVAVGGLYPHTIKVASTVPALATYVYLRRKSTFVATSLVDCAQALPFDSFTVKLNNITLFERTPKLVGTFEGESSASGGLVIGSGASSGSVTMINGNILKICWASEPNNRTSFTGALAFGGINNPEVTLYGATIGTDMELVYVNEYWNNLVMMGQDGSIILSTSQ